MEADDLILISVDDHIAEPADMFDAHVPATHKEYAPRVVVEETRQPAVVLRRDPRTQHGAQRRSRQAAGDVQHRRVALRRDAAGLFQRRRAGAGHECRRPARGPEFSQLDRFLGPGPQSGSRPDINLVMIKAYNDWHVDEWCGAYPGRFIPCGILPLFDVTEAAKEIKRLADKGCHAVTFSENPEALDMPSIHTKHWYPMFEAACENKTVLCTHVGSSSRSPMLSLDAPPRSTMTGSSI